MNTTLFILLTFFYSPALWAKAIDPPAKKLWGELERIEKQHQKQKVHLPAHAKSLIKGKEALKNYQDDEILDLERIYLQDEVQRKNAAQKRLRKRSR